MNNLLKVTTCTGDELQINVSKIYAIGGWRPVKPEDGKRQLLGRVFLSPRLDEDYVDTSVEYEDLIYRYKYALETSFLMQQLQEIEGAILIAAGKR